MPRTGMDRLRRELARGGDHEVWIRFPRQLGDVIFAWPFFAALQEAWNAEAARLGAKLSWVAVGHDIGAAVFSEASPDLVSRCLIESRGQGKPDPWELSREWKVRRPVAVINLSHSSRLVFAAWKARIPIRAGIQDGRVNLLYHHPIPYRGRPDHLALRFQGLLDQLAPGVRLLLAPITPDRFGGRAGLEKLRAAGWKGGAYVTLAFGTRGDPKRWQPERGKWPELARILLAQGLEVVWLGGPGEVALGAELAALAPGSVDLCGRTTLPEACAIQHGAYGNVAVDTGLAHTAAATGRPTVCVNLHSPEYLVSPVGPRVLMMRGPWLDAPGEAPATDWGSHRIPPARVAALLHGLAWEAKGAQPAPAL